MPVILIGIALIVLGRYVNREKRIPEDAITVFGSVTDIRTKRSRIHRSSRLYAPVIAYDHPLTGRREVLEPSAFYGRSPEIGDTIEVGFSPSTGRTYRAPEYRWEHLALSGFGIVMILFQVADWVF